MTSTYHPGKDWTGKAFGAPSPVLLTKSWRVKNNILRPLDLKYAASALLAGQDSTNAAACTKGLKVYAGYYNGTFANLNAFRADFPSAIILSITPNGAKGARCIDCEPGDATVAGAANFVAANLPAAGAGGRNDGGKPMVYCSAGDSQAVINSIAAKGISRSQWILWSAHWIGQHICSPSGCGYPAADATQYASNNSFDSDEFYSYCFGAVAPPAEWPLAQGSTYTADVKKLQQNINKWVTALAGKFGATALLIDDGSYGPLTEAAVSVAELYFGQAVTGTCSQALFNQLAGSPAPPPPPPSFTYLPPVALKVLGAGPHSVKFQFTANTQPHPGLAKFEVVICKGDRLTANIPGYPRYIDFVATGVYGQQLGGVEPATGYTMGIRAMAQDGSHSSAWALVRFTTAKA